MLLTTTYLRWYLLLFFTVNCSLRWWLVFHDIGRQCYIFRLAYSELSSTVFARAHLIDLFRRFASSTSCLGDLHTLFRSILLSSMMKRDEEKLSDPFETLLLQTNDSQNVSRLPVEVNISLGKAVFPRRGKDVLASFIICPYLIDTFITVTDTSGDLRYIFHEAIHTPSFILFSD